MPLMELGIHEVHWLISLQQLRHQPFPLVRLTFTNIYEHHILPISVRISAVNRTNEPQTSKMSISKCSWLLFLHTGEFRKPQDLYRGRGILFLMELKI